MKFLLLFSFLIVLSGCDSVGNTRLDLVCKGKHLHLFTQDGKKQRTEENWEENLSFKDKKRYSIMRDEYLSESCQIWTKDKIICEYKNTKTDFVSNYDVNRVTGDIRVEISLPDDSDIYLGKCEKIEKNKI